MSKKKFSLPTTISSELSDTIDHVKTNIGSLNYKVVPLDVIELDPDNPRELIISPTDLPQGPKESDPYFVKKLEEYESLSDLAETIRKYGVRNAVEIYKHGDKYRIIHGERRYLASIIAEKKEIPAKVLSEKPNDFDIRMLQLIENIQREDLTLAETLKNINQVIDEYKTHIDPNVEVNSTFLKGLINRSKAQCVNILSVLQAPKEIKVAITTGKLKSLEKAAVIASCKVSEKRAELLEACLKGASLKQLRQDVSIHKLQSKSTSTSKKVNRPGVYGSKINLGSTQKTVIIEKLVKLVINDPHYRAHKTKLALLDFSDYKQAAYSFRQLLMIMEEVEG